MNLSTRSIAGPIYASSCNVDNCVRRIASTVNLVFQVYRAHFRTHDETGAGLVIKLFTHMQIFANLANAQCAKRYSAMLRSVRATCCWTLIFDVLWMFQTTRCGTVLFCGDLDFVGTVNKYISLNVNPEEGGLQSRLCTNGSHFQLFAHSLRNASGHSLLYLQTTNTRNGHATRLQASVGVCSRLRNDPMQRHGRVVQLK